MTATDQLLYMLSLLFGPCFLVHHGGLRPLGGRFAFLVSTTGSHLSTPKKPRGAKRQMQQRSDKAQIPEASTAVCGCETILLLVGTDEIVREFSAK